MNDTLEIPSSTLQFSRLNKKKKEKRQLEKFEISKFNSNSRKKEERLINSCESQSQLKREANESTDPYKPCIYRIQRTNSTLFSLLFSLPMERKLRSFRRENKNFEGFNPKKKRGNKSPPKTLNFFSKKSSHATF